MVSASTGRPNSSRCVPSPVPLLISPPREGPPASGQPGVQQPAKLVRPALMIDYARGIDPVQRRDPGARNDPGGCGPQPADDLPMIGPRHLAPGDRRLIEDQLARAG